MGMMDPVFVVGSPRSGTTLFYHMLLSAGGFAVYRTEAHVFNTLVPRFGGLRTRADREELLRHWFGSEYFRRSGLKDQEIRRAVLERCTNGGDFLRILMEAIAAKQGVPRWAECTPENLLYVDQIKQSIPQARFVHIVRDGRDVAVSMSRQGWVKTIPGGRLGPTIVAGLYWEWMIGKGLENLRRYPADVIEVRYENLIAHPRQELARAGAFLEHDLDYERIQKVGIGSVSVPNTSFEKTTHDGFFNPVGRWQSNCTSKESSLLEDAIGGLLTRLGYQRASDPLRGAGACVRAERAMYRAQFGTRHLLKTRTPLGRYFTDTSLLKDFHGHDRKHLNAAPAPQ